MFSPRSRLSALGLIAVAAIAGFHLLSSAQGETGLAEAGPPPPVLEAPSWPSYEQALPSLILSFNYPPGWSPSPLRYCGEAPADLDYLPPDCVTVDFLGLQKAADVEAAERFEEADALLVSGYQARRKVTTSVPSGLASGTYTLLVYDRDTPFFGLVAYFGVDTDPVSLKSLIATIDTIVSTMRIQRQPYR